MKMKGTHGKITSVPIQTKIRSPDVGLHQESEIVRLDTLHQSVSVEIDQIQILLHGFVAKMVPDQIILRERIHTVFLQVAIAQLRVERDSGKRG